MSQSKLSVQNVPKLATSISLLVLTAFALSLYLCRKSDVFPYAFLRTLVPEYPSHISNLSISYILYTTAGFVWIQQGVPFKFVRFLGIAILLANLIYEIWIPFINTPDIIDAAYGAVGTALGYLFLAMMRKYGVKTVNGV